MIKTVDYIRKVKAGIDDLEGTLGDFQTEWWTEEDWKKWNDDQPNRERRNEEYIRELKEAGTFGKEYDFTISLIPNPKYDNPNVRHKDFDSWRMEILDFNKEAS